MILAIDPGKTGALALYNPDLDYLFTMPLPTQWRMVHRPKRDTGKEPTGKSIRRPKKNAVKRVELDTATLRDWLESRRHMITEAVIEQPASMPGQGLVSTFNFGKTCGQLEAVLIALRFPVSYVAPVVWKNALSVSSDKNQARSRARQLLPNHIDQFKDRTDEGRAEAAMVAYWFHQRKHATR